MRSIVGLAAMAALAACNNNAANKNAAAPAAATNAGAPAAPTGMASFTRDDLIGRWGAPTETCGFSTTFKADGTFTDHLFDGSAGGSGKWSLAGDTITLVYSDGRTVPDRIVEWKGDSFVHLVGDPPIRMIRKRCQPL